MRVPDDLARLVASEAAHAADFRELSGACAGAWPGLVREALAASGRRSAQRVLGSVGSARARVATDRRLPLPHPLDADWRFTRESAELCLDILLRATPPGRDILLVAMPTVALAARDRGLARRVVVAGRPGDPVAAALREAIPDGRFDDLGYPRRPAFTTIGLDPPWYDDVASSLIDACLAQLDEAGRIFVCVPDRFTMPSSAPGLQALARQTAAMGLIARPPVTTMRYATPFFEARCLEALGITNVDPSWRTGLLLPCQALQAGRARTARRLRLDREWSEEPAGPTRIWTKPRAHPEGLSDFRIAGSVSRSDPARCTARLWTSGNTIAFEGDPPVEAAACGGAPGLAAALEDELAAMHRTVDFI